MAKRSSVARLVVMIVVAVGLFMTLALGEDYVREFLARRQNLVVVGGDLAGVGQTVKKYDFLLVKAYAQDKPSLLAPVATEEQVAKVRLYMTYDQVEKKRKMTAELKNLFVEKTEKKGKKATVHSVETWAYRYKDNGTGKTFGRVTGSYKVTYSLVKVEGKWLVENLQAKPN